MESWWTSHVNSGDNGSDAIIYIESRLYDYKAVNSSSNYIKIPLPIREVKILLVELMDLSSLHLFYLLRTIGDSK